MEFKIGNIKPHNKIVMAPMAGISNQAYRTICKEMGAGLIYAEMVSDKGIAYQNVKTKKMCEVAESEHPIAMQIFGSDYKTITASAKEMVKISNFDILDVNMGCPVNKVIKNDSGSALLKYPDKIYDIVKSLKENVDLPVTIKIRAGYDFSSINCDEVARIACKAGVDAITIHGRTRSQLYTGKVNLDYIKMVKDASIVPVIGNGDITNIEKAEQMFQETNVDAIMIGRASLGNPWIFKELDTYFSKGIILPPVTHQEVLDMILEHARRLLDLKGEKVAMIEMRGHAAWYLKHIPHSKEERVRAAQVKTYDELVQIVKDIKSKLHI